MIAADAAAVRAAVKRMEEICTRLDEPPRLLWLSAPDVAWLDKVDPGWRSLVPAGIEVVIGERIEE